MEEKETTVFLGKAYIEHRDDGPYVYASFNDTPEAQHAKEAVRHGDVKYLSIWANKLKETAGNVTHGVIREVSLVYGGANPRAFIDHAVLAHGDGTYDLSEDEALIYMGLEADADIKEIEDRFWQMSKKYRGKDDPESLAMEDEISAVYDIASGRREVKEQEEYVRQNEPKYFGRLRATGRI